MIYSDPKYIDGMSEYIHYDNCYCVTLKPRCEYWYGEGRDNMERRLATYFSRYKMDYVLFSENPDGNLHYHGIIVSEYRHMQNFRRWYNNNFGHYHVSPKIKTPDGHHYNNGWEQYCKKLQKSGSMQIDNKIYMFND